MELDNVGRDSGGRGRPSTNGIFESREDLVSHVMRNKGYLSTNVMAEKYGVSQSTIMKIIREAGAYCMCSSCRVKGCAVRRIEYKAKETL